MGSSRLPGKALADVCGHPAIWHLFEQLRHARTLDVAVLATTSNPSDDLLAAYAVDEGWRVFRGSEVDVLDRYYEAAKDVGCRSGDIIVRVTGDDILVDPAIVDQLVELLAAHQPHADHVSNNRTPGFPYGADIECISFDALEHAWQEATLPEEREHVTPFVRTRPERFPFLELVPSTDDSDIHLSIDYQEDLAFNRTLIEKLSAQTGPPFHLSDIVRCIKADGLKHPGIPPKKETL